MAGRQPREVGVISSVSPITTEVVGTNCTGDIGGDGDERDLTLEGEDGERLAVQKEEDVLKKVLDPLLPTQGEIDRHCVLGHIPYRNWCPVGVKARGKDMPHQTSARERKIPEYSFDYFFPGDELGHRWTILAGKERMTQSFMATALPCKGGTGKFALDKCLESWMSRSFSLSALGMMP